MISCDMRMTSRTIGLLLCRGKDRLLVEYAIRDLCKPIGVADWETQILSSVPEELRSSLPSVEELEAELRETIKHVEEEPEEGREGAGKRIGKDERQ